MLRTKIAIASQNQRAFFHVRPHAVVKGRGVKERVGIEILRARADLEVGAVGRQIGFGFVGPECVEAFIDIVLLDDSPVPLRGIRVRRIDIRTGLVVGQAVGRRAVGQMLKPSVLENQIVVTAARL